MRTPGARSGRCWQSVTRICVAVAAVVTVSPASGGSIAGWAVGYGNLILNTTNGGATWTPQTSGVSGQQLFGASFVNADIGWAVGTSGTIVNSTDGGGIWSSQNGHTFNFLSQAAFADSSNGWAVGGSGTILHTSDGGGFWATQMSGTTNTLFGVSFANAQDAWAVGADGTVLHNTGTATWSGQTSNTTQELDAVTFVNTQSGWVIGNRCRFDRSGWNHPRTVRASGRSAARDLFRGIHSLVAGLSNLRTPA